MSRRPPRSTRTDTLFPYTTLVRSGYRPLIALQMIEVAGADRKFGRHRALVEPQLAPKPPKPCAQIEFALRRHGRTLSKIRSEEHTSELQSLMRISYAVFCLKKKTKKGIN